MNTELSINDCTFILAALEEIEDKYKALQKVNVDHPALTALSQLLGKPENYLENTRQELLEEGKVYIKVIKQAKAKITLLLASLEESEDQAGKKALMQEVEKALEREEA